MRYERKYKVEEISKSLVEEVIRLHPASFRKIYPDRQINNIYFDTPGLTAYKENVMGIASRKKYRVRWYGDDPHQVQSPKLEIKIKSNQLGYKESMNVAPFELNQLRPLKEQIRRLFPHMVLHPVLLNAYRRSYYGTSDGRYRITIDEHLRYCSLLKTLQFTYFSIEDPSIVTELKYDAHLDNDVDAIMQHLPFRQTKSSKYVSGVDLTMAT
ncbi:MAG: polyphosphate polymerase domain-containing protein [Bacteroidota bacterium]